ncbi:hypothetical protein BDY21DRAFT_40876 [Lineolata rhizophorae]|uniref:DH domain-containing protein n=1 Tax=Lineolata rhizophorae TaxID=578093 RepID=A0A6A6NYT3_9PEZI|nr:hypothetical protein BDY21DRAFT_40876 [Lineolata rhizophorae]
MQSGHSSFYHHHHPPPPRPTAEYRSPFDEPDVVGQDRDDNLDPAARGGALTDDGTYDPHDFYRSYPPYAESQSATPHRPDIVLENDARDMATVAGRRPAANGATPKQSPHSTRTRQGVRSASGPQSSRSNPTLGSSSSQATRSRVPSSSRTSNGANREDSNLDPLKENEYGPSKYQTRKPPKANAAAISAGPRSMNNLQDSSPARRRPLLFGEVDQSSDRAQNPGFGIPVATSKLRRLSEGSMHKPNPMFARGGDDSPVEQPRLSIDTASAQGHRRARSDTTTPIDDSSGVTPGGSRKRSPPSRIPISTSRRASLNSDSSPVSAINPANTHIYGATPPSSRTSKRGTATPNGRDAATTKRTETPTLTLSSRRYRDTLDNSARANNTKLRAHIVAPAQKESPPLRSSRPRLPVSVATTSASRARSSERPRHSGREGRPHKSSTANPRTRTRRDRSADSNMSFAERRAGAMKKIEKSYEKLNAQAAAAAAAAAQAEADREQEASKSDGGEDTTLAHQKEAAPALQVTDTEDKPAEGPKEPAEEASRQDNAAPDLSVDTNGVQTQPDQDAADSAHTTFEESPVLGMPGGFPTTDSAQQTPQIGTERTLGPADVTSTVSSEHTEFAEDSSSRRAEDEESIQIRYQPTPNLAGAPTAWQHMHDPSIGIEFVDDDQEPQSAVSDECSILPEDSISVAPFPRQYPRQPVEWSEPPRSSREQRQSLNDGQYTTISRVLGCYLDATHVPPEMAHECRREVHAVSPHLANFEGWSSKEASERYLAEILQAQGSVVEPSQPLETPRVPAESREDGVTKPRVPGLEDSPHMSEEYHGTALVYEDPERYSSGYRHTWGQEPRDRNSASTNDMEHSRGTSIATSEEEAFRYDSGNLEVRPPIPPKDRLSPIAGGFTPNDGSANDAAAQSPLSPKRPRLPEIRGTGEGLGIQVSAQEQQAIPPIPRVSPPPPPKASPSPRPAANTGHLSPSVYTQYPPSSVFPSSLPHGHPTGGASTYADLVNDNSALATPNSMPHSPASRNEEAKEPDAEELKRLTQRRHIIRELVDTEASFHQDMKIVEDIYKATSTAIDALTDEDRRTLFGNSDHVVIFAQRFLDSLKSAASPVYAHKLSRRWNARRGSHSTSHSEAAESPQNAATTPTSVEQDRKTHIGKAFRKNLVQLEKVYGDYLKNHHSANQKLQALQKVPKVGIWLRECHEYAKDITAAWDLDSLLIKPTQRMLKYPLLIKQLLEVTPRDHPDRGDLEFVNKELEVIADRINEAKKRADLITTALNQKESDSGHGFLSKLVNRRTEKLKQQVGLTEAFDDAEYNAVAQKFGGHFFQLQIVMRDFQKYVDDKEAAVKQCSALANCLSSWLDASPGFDTLIASRWMTYIRTISDLSRHALSAYKENVTKNAIDPIMILWKMHEGPQVMMAQRKKRLGEYANIRALKEKGGKMDKKLLEQMEQFEAINTTLKLELPKLYALTKNLVDACLLNFIQADKEWAETWSKKVAPLIEGVALPDMRTAGYPEIVMEFRENHAAVSPVLRRPRNNSSLTISSNPFSPGSAKMSLEDTPFRRPPPPPILTGKRTQSVTSDGSITMPNSGHYQRHSGGHSFSVDSEYNLLDGPTSLSPMRMRAGSAVSSRPPSTPRSASMSTPNSSALFQQARPSTAERAGTQPTAPSMPRLSADSHWNLRPSSGSTFIDQHDQMLSPGSYAPRISGVFNSAMPMEDSPIGSRPPSPEEQCEPKVLFLAASLFEFNIAHDRREAGHPYLRYVPGEIFDVIAQKGELWLAKNQDDDSGQVGWIWEKHFARILPDE